MPSAVSASTRKFSEATSRVKLNCKTVLGPGLVSTFFVKNTFKLDPPAPLTIALSVKPAGSFQAATPSSAIRVPLKSKAVAAVVPDFKPLPVVVVSTT